MADNIEKQVADGIISLLKARTYISTNTIPVISSLDQVTEKDEIFASIHAEPHDRIAPNYNFYSIDCNIVAASRSKADPDADKLHPLTYECQALANTLTAASLATATGLTIDGIVPMQGADSETPNNMFLLFSAKVKVHLTYTFT